VYRVLRLCMTPSLALVARQNLRAGDLPETQEVRLPTRSHSFLKLLDNRIFPGVAPLIGSGTVADLEKPPTVRGIYPSTVHPPAAPPQVRWFESARCQFPLVAAGLGPTTASASISAVKPGSP
jgi:hypothetical protein